MNKLEKAIFKTLGFYSILNRPLTMDELWRFLYGASASKLQVFIATEKLIKQDIIFKKNDYFVLRGRETIIDDFIKRRELNRKRWGKVSWVVKIISILPFVKNISIINSLSYNNSRDDSDIDLLIVAKKNRLWTARAFTILTLEILGQNKNTWYQANKFCLGFAFDETRLDLSKIRYRDDIDFIYWLANLDPIFDRGIYKDLILQNQWLKEELPNWEEKRIKMQISPMLRSESDRKRRTNLKMIERLLGGKFGDGIENWFSKIQINRIRKDPKNKRKDASVIADSNMMKLHPYDKRKLRHNIWLDLTKKLNKIK